MGIVVWHAYCLCQFAENLGEREKPQRKSPFHQLSVAAWRIDAVQCKGILRHQASASQASEKRAQLGDSIRVDTQVES
jgi:hypothetical protein